MRDLRLKSRNKNVDFRLILKIDKTLKNNTKKHEANQVNENKNEEKIQKEICLK